MDVTGVHQEDIACVQQKGFLAADGVHGAGGDVEDLDMCVPMAWDELVVGLVDVKIDGSLGLEVMISWVVMVVGIPFFGVKCLWHAWVWRAFLRSVWRRSVRVRLSRLPLFRVPKRAPEQSGDFMLLPELAFSFMESQSALSSDNCPQHDLCSCAR